MVNSQNVLLASDNSESKSYLEQRSDLAKRLRAIIDVRRVTIVEDDVRDADVLSGVLRRILGDSLRIDCARNMAALHNLWADGHPDLVFLDDRLGHTGTATTHLPHFTRQGYLGPVVVISGHMTRYRRAEVMQRGAAEVMHKDDLDTLAVMQLLFKLAQSGLLPRLPA